MNARDCRRAFTLVELLVVTGLIGALLGMITVGMRPNIKSQMRRSAQQLTSAFLAAQSRALGVPEGAGVILVSSGTLCTEIANAQMMPALSGSGTWSPLCNPASGTNTLALNGVLPADTVGAYKILFFSGTETPGVQPRSSWWEFAPPNTVRFLGASGTATGTMATRTKDNAIWPRAIGGSGSLQVLLARYPLKGSTSLQTEKLVGIDMRFSGVGNQSQDLSYARFLNDGSVAITFDAVGRVGEVMMQVLERGDSTLSAAAKPPPVSTKQTVFFLIAPRDDIAANAYTLANPDALWVALFPTTGRYLVSANVPQPADTLSSMTAAQILAAMTAARANAIAGIPVGR